MLVSRREWLEKLGLGGAAAVGISLASRADAEGDPAYARFNSRIKKISPSMTDVSSATLNGGKVIQPARELPVFHETDVVVVGGGSAGWGAAMGAAKTGARVAVIERDSSFGGLWTNGGVLVVLGNGVRDNGEFRWVTKGVCTELLGELKKAGKNTVTDASQPTVDPEALRYVMDQMLVKSGVDIFFRCWGVDVIQVGNQVKGVVFESKQGRQAILAKCVIDASGDGDVYFQAGAQYQQILHGMGFVYRMGNMDRVDKAKAKANHVGLGANEPVASARWFNTLGPQGNGLDVRELSKIEIEHRKTAWLDAEKMRAVEGCQDVFMMQTCPQVGVRATRLLKGHKEISKATAAAQTSYDDVVAVGGHDGMRLPEFQIPYGALIPQGVDNVIAAGRCISVAPDLIDRVRLIPVCVVTGHAAGVAGALAAKGGTAPKDVPAKEIQKALLEQGAYLGSTVQKI